MLLYSPVVGSTTQLERNCASQYGIVPSNKVLLRGMSRIQLKPAVEMGMLCRCLSLFKS